MRFYEVIAETEYFGDEESAETKTTEKKKRIVRKTDAFYRGGCR